MNVIQKSESIKTGSGKGFRTEAPKWQSVSAMDMRSVLMVN